MTAAHRDGRVTLVVAVRDHGRRVVRGVSRAVRGRPGVVGGVRVAVIVLSVLVPPLVLSLARRPVDFVTLNPWLGALPAYLASDEIPLAVKLGKLPDLALLWFSADSPYGGTDWGFAVDVTDAGRIVLTGALFGVYFALLASARGRPGPGRPPPAGSRRGGLVGMLTTVVGLSTGPCSVMGCGAPVMPVVGLAFAGLSSGTLAALSSVSRVATVVVLAALAGGVAWLGWHAGEPDVS